ncbi:MAG: VTT domain-containing protein [Planctomycetota bacterium]|nr:VTT domain-containing protein [Planctomycetota bacterium]
MTDSSPNPGDTPSNGNLTKAEVFREAGPAGFLAIAWTVLPAILGFTLLANLGPISEWLSDKGDLGILIYVAVFALSAGFGFLPTYAQAILGGWVFGTAIGLPAALVGFTVAAGIGYGLARLVSGNRVERILTRHRKSDAIRRALIGQSPRRTFGIVTLIRIPPNSPFALTNLLIAACGVRFDLCLFGTALGMLPRTAVAVAFAAAAQSTGAKDIQTFVSEGLGIWVLIGGIVLMLIVLMIIASIGQKALDRITADDEVGHQD